jgi:hypothetical protein
MGRFILFLIIVSGLISCTNDEPRIASISFTTETADIFESDATPNSFHPDIFNNPNAIGKEVRITLKSTTPVTTDVIVSFFVQGTASEQIGQTGVPDFVVTSGAKKVTFIKGSSEADIVLTLFEDLDFEVYENSNPVETILITLNKVESGSATLGSDKFFVLNVKEDDAVIYLNWDASGNEPGNQTRGDVDMDLLLTYEGEVVITSAYEGSDPEFMTIPGGFASGNYGLSYNYYSGTSDEVLFRVFIWNLGGALDGKYYNNLGGTPLVFSGTLGLENIFPWSNGNFPKTVQTFKKAGFDYSNLSFITRPASGSRVTGTSNHVIRKPSSESRKQDLNMLLNR